MLTLGAFLLAIGVLVAVHEWGHFAMARFCGVPVLRFSIGFGPRLTGWTSSASGTEYRLGMLPLGGYVAMLDEREGPVEPADLPFAFNRRPLRDRALIVAAGPLANLLLAVLLYALINWTGFDAPEARVARPAAGSLAAQTGWQGGERVLRATDSAGQVHVVASFDELNWLVARAALAQNSLLLTYQKAGEQVERQSLLNFADFDVSQADANLFRKIGFVAPFSAARIGEVRVDGAAHAAGLETGDLVLAVNGAPVTDGAQLREVIRDSGRLHAPEPQLWQVDRAGKTLQIQVVP